MEKVTDACTPKAARFVIQAKWHVGPDQPMLISPAGWSETRRPRRPSRRRMLKPLTLRTVCPPHPNPCAGTRRDATPSSADYVHAEPKARKAGFDGSSPRAQRLSAGSNSLKTSTNLNVHDVPMVGSSENRAACCFESAGTVSFIVGQRSRRSLRLCARFSPANAIAPTIIEKPLITCVDALI